MASKKSHKEEEHNRGRIRELEKLNRALKKRLRQLEKSKHLWEELDLDDEDINREQEVRTNAIKCSACSYGSLISIDLGVKYLLTCSSCAFRKIIKR